MRRTARDHRHCDQYRLPGTLTRASARSVGLAVILAPVLIVSLWIEVIAGTGTAWGFAQPGHTNWTLFAVWMAFAAAGPVTVVVATILTRTRLPSVTGRVLRIEKWGLIVVAPLGFIGILTIAAQSVI
jgi:hypothetical protein